MAAPTLTNPPVSPSVSRPATFDAEADAHLAWQATNVTEMGTVNTWIEGQTAEVTDQADIATAQAVIATTQAGIATTQVGLATTQAGIATTQAGLAATSAASAANAPGTSATSTTSLVIGAGAKSLTIQTGKLFALGQTVVIARTSDPIAQMTGAITAHNSVTGALSVIIPMNGFAGSGTYTDWTISLSGAKGEKGDTSSLIRVNRSSNTMITAADNGKYFNLTNQFSQTFDTPANLGNGWFCYIRNVNTDGISAIFLPFAPMYPEEERRVDCDGTTIRSIVINPFKITSTASSTFFRPSGYSAFGGLQWGAGASGRARRSSSAVTGEIANGGGSGACTPIWIPYASMPASISFTIGAGGAGVSPASNLAASGNDGGNSVFGSFTAYGGRAGDASDSMSGAGIFSKAFSVIGSICGGLPAGGHYTAKFPSYVDGTSDSNYGGGGGGKKGVNILGNEIVKGGSSVYGGNGDAGCFGDGTNFTTAAAAGNTVYGGVCGGSVVFGASSAIILMNVGTSIYGGAGGAASVGTGVRTGTAGGARGGGGGAAVSTDNSACTSGAGGRGELQLWGIL